MLIISASSFVILVYSLTRLRKLFVLALLPLILCGCGDKSSNSQPGKDSGGNQQVVQYSVHFANTNLSDVKVNAGGSLAKPNDPQKNNYIFVGWYSDAELTQEASFPMTINSETTIYAKFYSYQEE